MLVSEKKMKKKYWNYARDGKIPYLQYKTIIFKKWTQVF